MQTNPLRFIAYLGLIVSLLFPLQALGGITEPSIMYSKKRMSEIERALEVYLEQKSKGFETVREEEDFLTQLDTPVQGQEYRVIFPNIYLSAILFRGNDNWSAWINNQRITSKKPENTLGITIARISDKSATIHWKPIQNKSKFYKIYAVEENDSIRYLEEDETYEFTLHTNQTFSSYDMKILEGLSTDAFAVDFNGEEIKNVTTVSIDLRTGLPRESDRTFNEGGITLP